MADNTTPQAQTQIALDECKAEFDAALRDIKGRLQTTLSGPTPALMGSFAALFEPDFIKAFTDSNVPPSPTFPRSAWALARTQLLLKVDAIAALAASYALDEKAAAIEERHLTKAVLTVKPDCDVATHPPRNMMEFCAGFRGRKKP